MTPATLVTRAVRAAMLLATIAVAAVPLTSCSSEEAPAAPEESTEPSGDEVDAASPDSDADTEADEADHVMGRVNVQVYYPAESDDGLIGEPHEIFNTAAPGDRAKQILADLIAGPTGDEALRALPPGTLLRQVYVLDDGTAYVDFSDDLKRGMAGGSTKEIFAVYAIVNSVSLNIPEIRRVGILIEGEPVETLNGHVDLRRPLPPDASLIVGEIAPSVALMNRTMPGTCSGSASSMFAVSTALPLNRCLSPCVPEGGTGTRSPRGLAICEHRVTESEPVPA